MQSPAPLFQPNNHSVYEIAYRLSPPPLQVELAALVMNYYPVTAVEADTIAQVAEVENASNNFRISLTGMDGRSMTWLLRKHIRVSDPANLALLEKTIQWLYEQGITTPRLIKTKTGNFSAKVGPHFWQAYEFIEGHHYCGSRPELVAAAHGAAALHRALASYPYRDELNQLQHFLVPWQMADLNRILEAARADVSEIGDLFREYGAWLHGLATENQQRAAPYVTGARRQIIHGDFHPHNTLFHNGNLKAIFDFELMQEAELLRDFGFVAHRFARQYAVYGQSGAAGAQEGYRLFIETYGATNELSEEEVKQLPVFIRDELLRRIVKDFSLYYDAGDGRFASSKELNKKLILLAESFHLSS